MTAREERELDRLGRLQCHIGVMALVFGFVEAEFFFVAAACFIAALYTGWKVTQW